MECFGGRPLRATRRQTGNNDSWLRQFSGMTPVYAMAVRTGAEVAVFVTRRQGSQVLILHRSPIQGGYWYVVAGGVEAGEEPDEAARRELAEETSLVTD